MTTDQKTTIIFLSSLFIIGVLAWLGFGGDSEKNDIVQLEEAEDCVVKQEERVVRGNSLAGLIENGQTVKALFGYYDCRDIKREDVVLYSFDGNEVPLIKIIKGIPGDKFNLQAAGGDWHILINGEILKNSKGESYLLDERRFNMLSLYVRDYNAVIPEFAYLIMGNLVAGAVDSTQYGLIHKNDILGKAEILTNQK